MPSVTRHCRTKDCPFTPDEHDEWMELCSKAPEHGHRHDQLTHQHHPKIGMGGNNPLSKIVAIICWPMHDRIDNGDWGNAVKDMPGRGRVYFAWDIHGNTLIEREVLSDGADGAGSSKAERQPYKLENVGSNPTRPESSASSPSAGLGGEAATPPQVSPSPPLTKEESDERQRGLGNVSGPSHISGSGRVPNSGGDASSRIVPSLTHEQRVAIAQDIKDTEWNRQWFAGDIGNLWIEQLGESAEQYLSDFGYQPESLANILRVCAKIPPAYRNGNLRFSHHVVVAGENLEDVEMHLAECELNGWSVAEFRRQRKGTKPRVKRYSVKELREALLVREREIISEDADPNVGEHHVSVEATDFLDYLEEKA